MLLVLKVFKSSFNNSSVILPSFCLSFDLPLLITRLTYSNISDIKAVSVIGHKKLDYQEETIDLLHIIDKLYNYVVSSTPHNRWESNSKLQQWLTLIAEVDLISTTIIINTLTNNYINSCNIKAITWWFYFRSQFALTR